ncbi:hypothetical protein Nepgr_032716 [Nepenthes gracilis]|uniref:Phytochrome A-associated F-box protein n=1 Tax=Nepenthes gracilis TaxID=150966 RepID=A0AAD3TJ57_NEPGR|nr:hypothetical protein Nepgr_032716 [Nepenthes gracilis]
MNQTFPESGRPTAPPFSLLKQALLLSPPCSPPIWRILGSRVAKKKIPESMFSKLSDDVVLNILFKLEDDPCNWACLACVCKKFSSLCRDVCCKSKCLTAIPSIAADLSSASAIPPGGWSALHKIAVCCPGLHHAGVLLENSDFGLDRELGPDENYQKSNGLQQLQKKEDFSKCSNSSSSSNTINIIDGYDSQTLRNSSCWLLYDDLYFDTVYNNSESQDHDDLPFELLKKHDASSSSCGGFSIGKKRKVCRSMRSHLASGVWNLSREQGNKLLASRFRGDCLYICDWPGCLHMEEKRNYMLFRGIFKNFKQSRVWRTIKDGNRREIDLDCAFCGCMKTWDLHSAFCLRRVFGYHDDGEPVVRAYVCENGHVSGAWTDLPLYT